MTKRIQPHAIRACLFGGLLALLAGCNGDDQKDASKSTFPDVEPPIADNTKVPPKPVVGIVTEVPDTKPKPPVTTGGEAIPLPPDHVDGPQPVIDNVPGQIGQAIDVDKLPPTNEANRGSPEHLADDHRQGPSVEEPDLLKDHDDIRVRVGRFTEIAPDTIGGDTFQSSPAYEYNLGNLVALTSRDSPSSGDRPTFITPIQGWMRYPEKALTSRPENEKFPVIVFLHGQHAASDPSYKGYDYLAENLAKHGYIVFSIDANDINGEGGGGDESSQSRAQLVLATLDTLRDINSFGQFGRDGKPGALDPLKGKIDLSSIGIMGHSRGGEGVALTIEYNDTRSGTTGADLKTALLANPTSFESRFPGLAEAVIPGIEKTPAVEATQTTPAKPAIEAKPASIDEEKFSAALTEYNIFYASGSENPATAHYNFKGAFLLALTDKTSIANLGNVPLAALAPSCDGDVHTLDAAITYDHNRFGKPDDQAPRYQILVQGANHNFYNSEWTSDDLDNGNGARVCYRSGPWLEGLGEFLQLNRQDQERNALFLINSFMRYHVGNERKFAAYWSGMAQLPVTACPAKANGACDERVVLTIQNGPRSRKPIQLFDGDGTANEDGKILPDSMKFNALGGAVAFSGFDISARYAMLSGRSSYFKYIRPERQDDFAYKDSDASGGGFQSVADHVELVWSKPGAEKPETPKREVSITNDLMGMSTKGLDTLTFRIAVVRPMGQEVMVTLADSTGNSATVAASNFSDALYNLPRRKRGGDVPAEMELPMVDYERDTSFADHSMTKLLSMVAIPLRAFEGIDTTSLKELKLVFPKKSGKVAIADIELQNLGYDERMALSWPRGGNSKVVQTKEAQKNRLLLINQ
jgi:hypothetical protein